MPKRKRLVIVSPQGEMTVMEAPLCDRHVAACLSADEVELLEWARNRHGYTKSGLIRALLIDYALACRDSGNGEGDLPEDAVKRLHVLRKCALVPLLIPADK